jgi:hypothetical protein
MADMKQAEENFFRASQLGDVFGMHALGKLFDESDPQRWRCWGRAAALGNCWYFLEGFANQVELFNSESGSGAVMFAIGQALQGRVNEEKRIIFNSGHDFGAWIGPAIQAISFYDAQIQATRKAMRAWTLVGIRFHVVKDVRKMIAKLIWDSREEVLFKI